MKKAVLIIHGFAGTLKDHKYLEMRLKKEHYDVYTFLLPGHDKKIIRGVTRQEWIEASEKELQKILKKKYKEVTVFGHSMGSLIAGYLATKYPIDKLILSSPPYKYLKVDDKGLHFGKSLKLGFQLLKDKDDVSYSAVSRIFRVTPYVTRQLMKLSKERRNDPENIKIPVAIFEGSKDYLVPLDSALYAYDSMKSKYKKLIVVKDTKHPIFRSKRCDVAINELIKFLKSDTKIEKEEIINI